MSKVSIITTTHQRPWQLARAIESVLHQSYKDWTMHIIGDSADGGAKKIVESFNDPRLEYVHFDLVDDKYGHAKMDSGIGLADGKYIAFIYDDDYWLAQYLEKMVAILDGGKSLAFCKTWKTKEGKVLTANPPKVGDCNTVNCMLTADLAKKVTWWSRKYAADWDFIYKCLETTGGVYGHVDEVLAVLD